MIVYDRFFETLRRKDVSQYKLVEAYGIDRRTLQRLRHNQNITIFTLDKLCAILNCRLEEVAEYIAE